MRTPLLIKIRIACVIALGFVIFSYLCWPLICPGDPNSPLLHCMHDQPVRMSLLVIMFAMLSLIPALILGGPWAREIAPLIVPVGLCSLSLLSADMSSALVAYQEPATRAKLFYSLAAESLFWTALVIAGFWMAHLIKNWFSPSSSQPKQPASPATPSASSSNPITKFLADRWSRALIGLACTCIIAVILMIILLQSESRKILLPDQRIIQTATIPALGQTVFGIFTAFLLAAMISEQLFESPLWGLLPAPLIVAVFAYISTAQNGAMTAWTQVPPRVILPSVRMAAVLPVQYAGIAGLAVVSGFWLSLRARRNRRHAKLLEHA